jgi:hypothetical protein
MRWPSTQAAVIPFQRAMSTQVRGSAVDGVVRRRPGQRPSAGAVRLSSPSRGSPSRAVFAVSSVPCAGDQPGSPRTLVSMVSEVRAHPKTNACLPGSSQLAAGHDCGRGPVDRDRGALLFWH